MRYILAWPLWYLDRTPMYSVIIHVLFGLYTCALIASTVGLLGYRPVELVYMGGVIVVTALAVNYLCAKVTGVATQYHSSLITALILVLLILPSAALADLFAAAVTSALAIASKYVFIYRKQHLLNPVAAGLVFGGLLGYASGAWWVASPILFVPLVIGGLLVAEKIKRLDMVAVFLAVAFVLYLAQSFSNPLSTSELIVTFFVSFPFLFLGFFMLTEPFTMPSQRLARYWYAGAVASIASLPPVAGFVMTPELALVLGNIALAPWGQRQKLVLALRDKVTVTNNVYEFVFSKPKDFNFIAGQYLEWMVPHAKQDSRGNRRYFTIASAPEETDLRVAFKVPENSSSFKQAMVHLADQAVVIASQRAGDFILPTDTNVKLGFIAGGIGVTPFVSQARSLTARQEKRDIVTLYGVAERSDLAYEAVLREVGAVIPVVARGETVAGDETGFISKDIITRRVSDYASRTWYISGPPKMVDTASQTLRQLGVPTRNIHRDFFPGLA